MSIEELTKTQLVLLVLFVSFVTSIASGIVTVSLLGDTPLPITVTQTVNKVVERTVERVVPGQTLVREVPTIVSDEDLLAKTITSSFPAIVRVSAEGVPPETPSGLGFIVSSDGLVLTTADQIPDPTKEYFAHIKGDQYPLTVRAVNLDQNFALLAIGPRPGESAKNISKLPTIALDEKLMALGQSVVGHAGDTQDAIALGVITGLVPAASSSVTVARVQFSENKPIAGSPVLTYRGGVVGMWTGAGPIVYTAQLRAAVADFLKRKVE